MRTSLYWAYGSNLNKVQMKRRCPKARPLGKLPIQGGELVFRSVADVVSREDSIAMGGLWHITKDCEAVLDAYEGVGQGFYRKSYMIADHRGETVEILFYQMNSRGIMPPPKHYFQAILQGYEDFGLDKEFLHEALERSWKGKRKTKDLVERYLRKGKPQLARLVLAAADDDAEKRRA
jgi:hypothetical protein